jgi:hypothetical protein
MCKFSLRMFVSLQLAGYLTLVEANCHVVSTPRSKSRHETALGCLLRLLGPRARRRALQDPMDLKSLEDILRL